MNPDPTGRGRAEAGKLCLVALSFALLATSLSLGAPDHSEAAKAPKRFFGVHPLSLGGDDYAAMADANVGLLRISFNFSSTKTEPDAPYDWSQFDAIVAGSANNGIDLLPGLYGVPRWISTKRTAIPLDKARPEWRDYLTALVERYGSGGEFWSLNPTVAYRPIEDWQVWNESNLLNNWKNKPNAKEYGRLLTLSAKTIHAVDPRAQIVTAGIVSDPVNRKAIDGDVYLKSLLKSKSAARATDAIGIHPYTGTVKQVKSQLTAARRVIDRAGLKRTPIWVTEVGWGSGKPGRNPLIVSAAQQKRRLRGTFEMALKKRRRLGLERMVWYQWQDGVDEICGWCETSGLLTANGVAKPLLKVFAGIARL